MNFPESELWNFSTQTYQIPEVEAACLKLQDEFSADVNIILYCCWLGENNIELSPDEILVLIQTTEPWQNSILKPLRNARRMMKNHIIAMPAELLDQTISNMNEMEINSERMEQQSLEKVIDISSKEKNIEKSPVEITTTNLSLYFQQLDSVSSINDVSNELTSLLDAIYKDAEAIQMALMTAAS